MSGEPKSLMNINELSIASETKPTMDTFTYHKLFSGQICSSHPAVERTNIYWGTMDMEIYRRVFSNRKSNMCNLCQDISHFTEFCPLTVNAQPGTKTTDQHNFNIPTKDIKGRAIVYHLGQQIGNNFQEDRCTYPQSHFLHACHTCKKKHPQSKCRQDRSHASKDASIRDTRKTKWLVPEQFHTFQAIESPVRIEILRSTLAKHPDRHMVSTLVTGFTWRQETPHIELDNRHRQMAHLCQDRWCLTDHEGARKEVPSCATHGSLEMHCVYKPLSGPAKNSKVLPVESGYPSQTKCAVIWKASGSIADKHHPPDESSVVFSFLCISEI